MRFQRIAAAVFKPLPSDADGAEETIYMHRPQHIQHRFVRAQAMRVGLLLSLCVFVTALAAARANAATPGDGSATTITFTTNKTDQQALRAHRQANALRAKASHQQALADQDTEHIAALETLLQDAEYKQQQLTAALDTALVQQYEQGDSNSVAFLLNSHGLSDVLDRVSLIQQAQHDPQRIAAARNMSVAQVEQLESVLQSLRNLHGERAATLSDTADTLDSELASAKVAHIVHDANQAQKRDAAPSERIATTPSTWFVMPKGGQNSLYAALYGGAWGGQIGAPYGGGTLTPQRPSTPQEIATVLNDPRITLEPAGREDVATGQIDGRVLDALELLADRFNSITVTMLKTGHDLMTESGNVSEHAFGCAADIGTVNGILIQRSTQGPGTITEQVVKFLSGLTGDLAPHQVISLYGYGGPSLALPSHYNHIHLGYHC